MKFDTPRFVLVTSEKDMHKFVKNADNLTWMIWHLFRQVFSIEILEHLQGVAVWQIARN